MIADAAPRIVTIPKTSVIRFRVLSLSRSPIKIPAIEPKIMVAIFSTVPIPGNIYTRVTDKVCRCPG